MSLATRCTACGTIFRVVQDQLRVSEGWVRCGRCAEVFDAREQLFDIDREAPPPWPAGAVAESMADEQVLLPPSRVAEPDDTWRERVAIAPEPAPPAGLSGSPHRHGARLEPCWTEDDEGVRAAESQMRATDAPVEPHAHPPMFSNELEPDVVFAPAWPGSEGPINAPTAGADAPTEVPSFMRPHAGDTRWQSVGARSMLAGGLVLALALLALQFALHFHDAIAALYPQARPALQTLCRVGGCSVRPWQRIDVVSVESSALTQAGPATVQGGLTASINQYLLSVSLHNKSGVEVATPAVELSLLDASGSVSLRRVLIAKDFRIDKAGAATPPAIAAGGDLPLRALLSTGDQRVSGYSVEIFQP